MNFLALGLIIPLAACSFSWNGDDEAGAAGSGSGTTRTFQLAGFNGIDLRIGRCRRPRRYRLFGSCRRAQRSARPAQDRARRRYAQGWPQERDELRLEQGHEGHGVRNPAPADRCQRIGIG